MKPENSFEIPFQKLHPEASAPSKAHKGDAGYDLRSVEKMSLPPGGRALVKTGISIAIPTGWAGFVLPRSGLSVKHGVSLVNTPGLIDSGYRGEIMVPLINHDRDETFEVEVGMRISQLVLVRVGEAAFSEVALLNESSDGRGEGGFGSSGR
ncbi:MAG: dUTP diphosphatase [Rubrobacter sp.]|jgi:dUTP pyrophosphatase|nr:dUTP diphosphatase [Rubrobacter sp.]